MTSLTPSQVRHIASLARLKLSEEEVAKFTPELAKIFDYISQLSEVNTDGVEPTAQVTGLTNCLREDAIRTDGPATEELLATSPLTIVDRQIVTSSAHGER